MLIDSVDLGKRLRNICWVGAIAVDGAKTVPSKFGADWGGSVRERWECQLFACLEGPISASTSPRIPLDGSDRERLADSQALSFRFTWAVILGAIGARRSRCSKSKNDTILFEGFN